MTEYIDIINENNKTHIVDKVELNTLVSEANTIYHKHFDKKVWFERSLFTNWTCGIADCKYCYLSTKPKLDKKSVRSRSSILAEALVCRLMDWKVGYITGGLRVESTDYMKYLLTDLEKVLGYKIMMNYGPYSKNEIEQFRPYVTGMGCAIESFDEQLHEYICPSKPLKALLRFLADMGEMQKLITIILGIGERKSDVEKVIEQIHKYNITTVQLCFLKAQENTVFSQVPAPNMDYMAWWTAKLRIACPTLKIKIALVRDRIEDFSLLLQAGANCFSRYMIYKDFSSDFARQLQAECEKEGRILQGQFEQLPENNISSFLENVQIEEKDDILEKANRYYERLQKQAL